jgi:ankyrin repeat protein
MVEVARLLLDCGADVNHVDCNGSTPLKWASFRGRREVVALLLARGADPSIADATGAVPLMSAAYAGAPMGHSLISHMAMYR